jgi:hypothetical protein
MRYAKPDRLFGHDRSGGIDGLTLALGDRHRSSCVRSMFGNQVMYFPHSCHRDGQVSVTQLGIYRAGYLQII